MTAGGHHLPLCVCIVCRFVHCSPTRQSSLDFAACRFQHVFQSGKVQQRPSHGPLSFDNVYALFSLVNLRFRTSTSMLQYCASIEVVEQHLSRSSSSRNAGFIILQGNNLLFVVVPVKLNRCSNGDGWIVSDGLRVAANANLVKGYATALLLL